MPSKKIPSQSTTKEASCGIPRDIDILVVDDVEANRFLIEEMIRRNMPQCRSEVAENGAVAVQKVKDGRYGVILMDCEMPVMNGYAATKAIRDIYPAGTLPVIALTASDIRDVYKEYIESGMDDFLTKPINRSEFIEKICYWAPLCGDHHEGDAGAEEDVNTHVEARIHAAIDKFGDAGPKYAALLLKDTHERYEGILTALEAEHHDDLALAAHALKSVMAQVHADICADLCARLEAAAKDGDMDSCLALRGRFIHAFNKAYEGIERYKP